MNARRLLYCLGALSCLLTKALPMLAQNWTLTSAPIANWSSVACSADGSRLVAVGAAGIYTSTNSGSSWRQTSALVTNWNSVASSADGATLAASGDAGVFTSADSGNTWLWRTNLPFSSLASSADGLKLVGAGWGTVFTTADSGATWFSNEVSYVFSGAVACSADGIELVLAVAYGEVFTSTNAGASWGQAVPSDDSNPTSVASSADGTVLHVAFNWLNGFPAAYMLTSSDSGAAWTPGLEPAPGSLACSADGLKLVTGLGSLYTSSDSGANWTSNSAPTANWVSVASSSDGSKRAAAANGGGIWLSQVTSSPSLSITPSGSNVLLSWTIPSQSFTLQQSSALSTTNWMDVTNVPVLNLTNLQNQVLLPRPAAGSRFYRLKH